jgi:hypothetical protein
LEKTYGDCGGREAIVVFRKKKPPPTGGDATEDKPAAPDASEQAAQKEGPAAKPLPSELLWLADAPMFIDEKQVEAFYDAVLRPDYEGTSLTLSSSISDGRKIGGSASVGSAIPWLKAEATGTLEKTTGQEAGQQAALRPISNAFRHLLALTIHYATELPDRLAIRGAGWQDRATDITADPTFSDEYIQKTPRALLLLDLPDGTRLIPAALELTEGRVEKLFETFANKSARDGESPPKYPPAPSTQEQRDEYWQWFADRYSDRTASETIEEALERGGRIAWIDFRVPLSSNGPPFMHLHIAARGNYETGVFAYNLINRGYKHGLRLVGTLKSEPDLNVLAIYER